MEINKEHMPKHIAIIMDGIEDGQELEEKQQVMDTKKELKL